ncbi:MAG: hypothetical protein K2N74_04000 [Clostridiales bacterium]|nr:hypothetical protein [Clostridiales bacterium]
MRKFYHACKAFFILFCSLGAALFALLLYRAPVFPQGESYELYFGNSSSASSVRTDNPLLQKLLTGAKGESVRYTGDKYEELKEKFGATLLFTETVCGITNYYMYSPMLGETVNVGGYAVNLHVAVSEEQTAAGTPLIFGGF